jgi:hypothetical protein
MTETDDDDPREGGRNAGMDRYRQTTADSCAKVYPQEWK